jgi:hypothetical protein
MAEVQTESDQQFIIIIKLKPSKPRLTIDGERTPAVSCRDLSSSELRYGRMSSNQG